MNRRGVAKKEPAAAKNGV
jgi:hypothetical protein